MGAGFQTGEQVVHAFFERWNAHDSDGVAALFVDDADFVNAVGIWWRSNCAICKALAYGFERIFGRAKIELHKVKTRRLHPDIEIVHITSTLFGQKTIDGQEVEPRPAVLSFVTERKQHGIPILTAHNTDQIPQTDTLIRANGSALGVSYQQPRRICPELSRELQKALWGLKPDKNAR
ncbi:MAG: SgcJ/EcaC family oxidoreductase [Pseudomonadota bacterium]